MEDIPDTTLSYSLHSFTLRSSSRSSPSLLDATLKFGVQLDHEISSAHRNTLPQIMFPLPPFVLGTLAVFVLYYWTNGLRQGRHLPPGPKKLPVIGNLLSMPRTLEWETFAKWGQEHGP
jgi:hypothetical protein